MTGDEQAIQHKWVGRFRCEECDALKTKKSPYKIGRFDEHCGGCREERTFKLEQEPVRIEEAEHYV
jgi:hypothetical protein